MMCNVDSVCLFPLCSLEMRLCLEHPRELPWLYFNFKASFNCHECGLNTKCFVPLHEEGYSIVAETFGALIKIHADMSE